MVNKLLPSPWMKSKLTTLLGDSSDGRKQLNSFPNRMVQVLVANEADRFLIISEIDSRMTVMLTEECVAQLASDDHSVSDLRHSMIRLVKYHFSTTIQCTGFRDEEKFSNQKITFPIVIQCSEVKYVGAFGVDIIEAPRDLNSDPDIAMQLKSLTYPALVERLACRQFPKKGFLPNSGL